MKYRTTLRDIRAGYRQVVVIPYCNAQTLLTYQDPVAYAAGVYGWNCDVYDMGGGVAICTGYRPTGNIRPDCLVLRRFEEKAKKINSDYSQSWEERRDAVNLLLRRMLNIVTA